MVDVIVWSFVLFVALVAGVGVMFSLVYACLLGIVKVEDLADKYGGWVNLAVLLAFCYLASLVVSFCIYLGRNG